MTPMPHLPSFGPKRRPTVVVTARGWTPRKTSPDHKREAAAKQGVQASLPERIVWAWLERRGLSFAPQVSLMGGVGEVGGARVDFVVYGLMGQPVVLRVMGGYWHGAAFPERQRIDVEQANRLRLNGYAVVDLVEQDIYDAVEYNRMTAYIEGEISRQG